MAARRNSLPLHFKAAIAACLICWPLAGTAAEREAADGLPAAHRLLHEKLSQPMQVHFRDAPLKEVVAALSASLGAPVKLEGKVEVQRVTLDDREPMTHFKALRRLTRTVYSNRGDMTIDHGGIAIADGPSVRGRMVLRRHDLSGFSDYTTLKRERLIRQIQAEVESESWGRDGGWVVASPDVFAVDVYQTSETHDKIAQFIRDAVQAAQLTKEQRELAAEQAKLASSLSFWRRRKSTPAEDEELVRQLRRQYPYQSLSDRLKDVKGHDQRGAAIPLSETAAKRLDDRERYFARPDERHIPFSAFREESLRKLHAEKVTEFINRQGAGVMRIEPPGPSYIQLPPIPRLALPSAEALPRAEEETASRIPNGAAQAAASDAPLPTATVLSDFHLQSETNFLLPQRFGHVKDADHVAGFAEHAFTSVPRVKNADGRRWDVERSEQWAVRRLELVSLLKHNEPAVYISAELPRMDELRQAPTRKLTDFETAALQRLRNGEDVITRATTNRIEMVGSLRSINKCAECHDSQRGELLGAFSYELVRDPPLSRRPAAISGAD